MTKERPSNIAAIKILSDYKTEVYNEWLSILKYWAQYTIDDEYGGFYGSVDNNNNPRTDAAKGIVMNSRILWTFSASSIRLKNKLGAEIADRAFNYIMQHFTDKEFGGVFWSVDHKGAMLDGRKQIYGLAFCIYGMSEYYKMCKNPAALDLCKTLFNCIEQCSYDEKYGGYFEAFTREWKIIDDLRLSEKDENEKKTMNTHLHIVEAYANLYDVWPDELLKQKIIDLLDNFDKHIINKDSFHLHLFMDELWNSKSSLISYGHDIEAAWLLLQCAERVEDDHFISIFKNYAVQIVNAAAEGIDDDGGMWYEYEPMDNKMVREKHSWPQAEAMIGFMNVFQLSGNEKYLHQSLNSWEFIKNNMLDKKNGEWFWGVHENNTAITAEDKAGFWKCPYHNSRACMEIQDRISLLS
ncbi:MAG: AGE family epimerase/isomerase [Ferruginibacter sp.]